MGGLVAFNGALYGTTEGDRYDNGTIFEVSTSGQERLLYRFQTYDENRPAGCWPARLDWSARASPGIVVMRGLGFFRMTQEHSDRHDESRSRGKSARPRKR
jgi:uncharacterized repeat protein (TIGR03803 family)